MSPFGATPATEEQGSNPPAPVNSERRYEMSMNTQGDAVRELQVRAQLGNLLHNIERLDKAIAQISARLSPVLFHRDQTGEKESIPVPGLCDLAAEIRGHAGILAELGDRLDMIFRSLEI